MAGKLDTGGFWVVQALGALLIDIRKPGLPKKLVDVLLRGATPPRLRSGTFEEGALVLDLQAIPHRR